jgi:hypothetical protein
MANAISNPFLCGRRLERLDYMPCTAWILSIFFLMSVNCFSSDSGQPVRAAQKNAAASSDQAFLIRWSIQEIRRISGKLAQRRIQPAHIIAWSLWRRAHQADARRAHLKRANLKRNICNCNARFSRSTAHRQPAWP